VPTTPGCPENKGKHLSLNQRAVALINFYPHPSTANEPRGRPPGLPNPNPVPFGIVAQLVAISQAESSGYTHACNLNSNGTYDRGFMQINSSHGYGSSSFEIGPCAEQAWAVYKGQGLKAWTTWHGPVYYATLAPAIAATMAAFRSTRTPFTLADATQLSDWARAGKAAGAPGLDATGQCVHHWKTPSAKILGVGPGGATICFDEIIGGLKIGLGVVMMMVFGLALLVLVSRSVTGPAAKAVAGLVPEVKAGEKIKKGASRAQAARKVRKVNRVDRDTADQIEATDKRPGRRDPRVNRAIIDRETKRQPVKKNLRPVKRTVDAGTNQPPKRKKPPVPRHRYAGTGARPSKAEAGTPY
jgi:hypothetical protein